MCVSSRLHWSVAVFAHNEAHNIIAALKSLPVPAKDWEIEVHVLANGCTDETEELVRLYAQDHPWVRLESIAMADKANCWNEYVHRIAPDADVHFFTDADVLTCPDSFELLDRLLVRYNSALAAGGFPQSGRNREGWSRSMRRGGNLAGGLYALPRRTLGRLREIRFRQPIGWIGEDTLLSLAVRKNLGRSTVQEKTPLIVFDESAGFTFLSLSPWRAADWRNYWMRKIRYATKRHQFLLLIPLLKGRGLSAIPEHVHDLYCNAPYFPRITWNGRNTLFDVLSLRRIRKLVRRLRKENAKSCPSNSKQD